MKMIRRVWIHSTVLLLFTTVAGSPSIAQTVERKAGEYPLMADSLPRDGVPKGRLEWRRVSG